MKKICSILILILLIGSLFSKDIAIIVNKSNAISEITSRDLRRIYLSDKKKWDNGKNIMTLTLSASTKEREVFQSKVLGFTVSELKKYFNDQQIKGKTVKPAKVQKSTKAVEILVSKIPMAIGYLFSDEVKNKNIKILKVDGKLPGESGYPIH